MDEMTCKRLLQQMIRLQDQHLQFPHAILKKFLRSIEQFANGSILPVERLDIEVVGDSEEVIQLDHLFAAIAPTIQTLRLNSHGAFSWPAKPFDCSMRSLHITQRDRCPYELGHLLHILAHLPGLECLELHGMLPWCDPATASLPEVLRPLVMTRLSKLQISGSVTSCAWFLAQLRLPALVDIQIHGSVTSDTAIQTLGPVLNARFADESEDESTQANELLTFVLDVSDGWDNTHLIGWNVLSTLEMPIVRAIRMTLEHTSPDHQDTPIHCCKILPLLHVKRLLVKVGGAFFDADLHAWTAAFKDTMPSVEMLEIIGQYKPVPFALRDEGRLPLHIPNPDGSILRLGVPTSYWKTEMEGKLRCLFPALRQISVNGTDSHALGLSEPDGLLDEMIEIGHRLGGQFVDVNQAKMLYYPQYRLD